MFLIFDCAPRYHLRSKTHYLTKSKKNKQVRFSYHVGIFSQDIFSK